MTAYIVQGRCSLKPDLCKRACKAKTMMRLPGFLPCRVLSRTIGYADIRDVEVMRSHLVPEDAQRVVWNLCPRQQRSEGRQYRDRHGKSNRSPCAPFDRQFWNQPEIVRSSQN